MRDALDEAVRVHLRSDVPLGVCLSGGLDSSAIVGLASRHVERVKTFTVYFGDGPDYDERQHAHPIVEQFGADAVRTLHRADGRPRHAEADRLAPGRAVAGAWASTRSGT